MGFEDRIQVEYSGSERWRPKSPRPHSAFLPQPHLTMIQAGDLYLKGYEHHGEAAAAACPIAAATWGRHRQLVVIRWRTPEGRSGGGEAIELTRDGEAVWLFVDPRDEIVVRIEGLSSPQPGFQIYASQLEEIDLELTVDDARSSCKRTYSAEPGLPMVPVTHLDTLGGWASVGA